MREILFRGKSKAVGSEWLYGDALIYEKSAQIWETINSRKHNSVVSLETIGQYIGLTDKNGKRIFEGDIVNIEYPETTVKKCVIEYVGASFVGSTLTDNWELDGYYSLKVIGNIHDNPELLEGDNE